MASVSESIGIYRWWLPISDSLCCLEQIKQFLVNMRVFIYIKNLLQDKRNTLFRVSFLRICLKNNENAWLRLFDVSVLMSNSFTRRRFPLSQTWHIKSLDTKNVLKVYSKRPMITWAKGANIEQQWLPHGRLINRLAICQYLQENIARS